MDIIRIITVAILLLTAGTASAGPCDGVALQINGLSKHLADGEQAKKSDFRGRNPGVGLVCRGDGSDWMIGAYKNSVYRDSMYLANHRYLRWGKGWHADIGFAYGIVTGYGEQKRIPKLVGDASLLGYITASAGHIGIGKINIAWLPTVMVAVNFDVELF